MTGPILVTGGSGLLGSAVRELHPQAVFLNSDAGDLRLADLPAHRTGTVRAGERGARIGPHGGTGDGPSGHDLRLTKSAAVTA